MSNAAILYHPDGYVTSGPKLMGRQAAGEGFLRGFLAHAQVDRFYCLAATRPMAEQFAGAARGFRPNLPVHWIAEASPWQLKDAGTLFLPGPGLSDHARRRRHIDQRDFSICGITHTTASAIAMDAIAEMLIAPVQPWDALICTSRVVHETVRQLLQDQMSYLADRLNASTPPLPQLPIIPLGVETALFRRDDAVRRDRRARLGIPDDAVVVLFVGRLSFHAKAQPVPMYMALERAARRTGRPVHLVLAGWYANDFIANAFRSEAAAHCPSVTVHDVDARSPEWRHAVWSVGDLFTSLSDNIQETYGLTPVEAMAAGLPQVVSDWNGYRDTVRDGVDGFRIRTCMPQEGLGTDLAVRHETGADSYDVYCGNASLLVSVDVEACADAYARLILDADLRRTMGDAARQRAVQEFDWSVIIRRYQALWSELAEIRRDAAESAARRPGQPANPTRPDPFRLFSSYPSIRIGADIWVTLADTRSAADRRAQLRAALDSPTVKFGAAVLGTDEELGMLLDALPEGGTAAADLLVHFPEARRATVLRSIVWLAKFGFVSLNPPAP